MTLEKWKQEVEITTTRLVVILLENPKSPQIWPEFRLAMLQLIEQIDDVTKSYNEDNKIK